MYYPRSRLGNPERDGVDSFVSLAGQSEITFSKVLRLWRYVQLLVSVDCSDFSSCPFRGVDRFGKRTDYFLLDNGLGTN